MGHVSHNDPPLSPETPELLAPRSPVLLVDDEPEVLNALNRQLRREFDVLLAHRADEALAILSQQFVQVVISDERMPGMTGSALLSQVRERYPHIVRLLLTGYADLGSVIHAINEGRIYRYITKPWDPVEMRTIVRDACERYRLLNRNRRLLDELQTANELLERRVGERTERLEQALRELRDSEQRYRNIVDNISEPVMITDVDGCILSVNPAFVQVTGYRPEEVCGRRPGLLRSDRPSDEFRAGMRRQLREKGHWRGHIWNRRKDGEVYVQRLTISSIADEHGVRRYYIAVYNDLSEEMRELEKARFLAQHDPLTGLPNRGLLFDRLAEAIRDTRRLGDGRVGVLFIDLDGFKAVNDQHGHDVGDVALQWIAQRLRQCTRESDTVARLGGDEFVVVLRQIGAPEHAAQVAGKILGSLRAPCRIGPLELSLAASIGIALWPDDGDEAKVLLKQADRAMYAVKQQGRAAWRFCKMEDEASISPGR